MCMCACRRYLNSTAAKYLFRADKMADAQRMAALFTKDGDQASNLHDMQCTWYEIECGSAHLRLQEHGQVRQFPLIADRILCFLFKKYIFNMDSLEN